MKIFKKIDNYLLHNFPNIWVTKTHIFLPIALIFIFLFYFFNVVLIGYNPKNPIPQGDWAITLMIIPVLVFVVYWFVIQARYNVEKSGGKLSIPLEYMNYFLYLLMFAISYVLITFIPFTNDVKVGRTANRIEIVQDIKNINAGRSFVTSGEALRMKDDKFVVNYVEYVDDYYWANNSGENKSYYDEYENLRYINYEDYCEEVNVIGRYNLKILASRSQLKEIVEKYIESHNKYTYNTVIAFPSKIVANKLIGFTDQNQDYFTNGYSEYSYYDWNDRVDYKLEQLGRIKLKNNGALEANYTHEDGFKIILSFLLMLALFVWIFKQIHWRNYVFGLIALAMTPVVVGILGFIMFGILDLGEDFAWFLLFTAYIAAIIIVINGFLSNHKSRFAIVTAMYLQVFLPFLPAFILLADYSYKRRQYNYYYTGYNEAEMFIFSFYAAVVVGLISIGLFKFIYKKMRLLPNYK